LIIFFVANSTDLPVDAKEKIEDWLEQHKSELSLFHPSRILNMDESPLVLSPIPKRTIAKKGGNYKLHYITWQITSLHQAKNTSTLWPGQESNP